MEHRLRMAVYGWIRGNYDQTFLDDISDIIYDFYLIRMDSKILSTSEQMELLDLVFTELTKANEKDMKSIDAKLLYRGSEHQFDCRKFHEFCDNKGATLTIIKSEKGNIFGGYTSKSLSSEYKQLMDSEAFVFLIKSDDEELNKKCPLRFKIKKDRIRHGVTSFSLWGPTFGSAIVIGGDRYNAYSHCTMTSDYKGLDGMSLCGGTNTHFVINDYEVFKLSFLNC